MEEFVGGLWHRFITRVANRSYPEAAVRLADMEKLAGILFRAFGGDAGLQVAHAGDTTHGARRSLLQRIAGSGEKTAHAAVDGETLRLPPEIAFFPERSLNRDLYLWLIALAASQSDVRPDSDSQTHAEDGLKPAPGDTSAETRWLIDNQQTTLVTLARFPGLASRYRRLTRACITLRLPLERLPKAEAARENALRGALLNPGSIDHLPPVPPKASKLQPVPLWLYPSPGDQAAGRPSTQPDTTAEAGQSKEEEASKKRYRAKREESPESKNGMLIMFRAESLLSWGEYVKVNRHTDDEENPDAAKAAEDMDEISVAPDGSHAASRVRFDLDLPSAAEDDTPLGDGIPLPEWDWKKRSMKPDYCRLQMLTAQNAIPTDIPQRLARPAKRLRSQFAALAPVRRWLKSQQDGSELDVDACVRAVADRAAGVSQPAGTYQSQVRCERDLACLVLADLSLSTDAYVNNHQRVIDVIRDSLMLFAEALSATGDRFGLYGFSSLKRGNVRFHEIKTFDGRFDPQARGRIAALKPGYYTRMGAAIRQSVAMLDRQPSRQRVLLILSDGKPNDLDQYEGRYGIEDTRMAVLEAKKAGISPFCVTIDREGAAYLPHVFGPAGYTIIRKPEELPARLPMLYAQITG